MGLENSRYKRTTVVVEGEDVFYAIRTTPKFAPRYDDRKVKVVFGDDLTKLAYRSFGDPSLWWVVADFNDIIDPLADIEPGTELRVPSNTRLILEVLK